MKPDCEVMVELFVEQVEAGRQVAVEEARLGEAQLDLQALERAGQRRRRNWPLPIRLRSVRLMSPMTPSVVE